MKRKKLLPFAAVTALLVALMPCAVTPAFANSGPAYEYGVTSSGAMVMSEGSVLAVESEKLTFEISDLPDNSIGENIYAPSVTAEYHFLNTSQNTVRTTMAFPIGNAPYYADESEVQPVNVTVNGDKVNVQTRHTREYKGDFYSAIKDIRDDYAETDFYKRNTPVYKYVMNVETQGNARVRVTAEIQNLSDSVRVIADNTSYFKNSCDTYGYFYEEGGSSTVYNKKISSYSNVFYLVGDPSAVTINYSTQVQVNNYNDLFAYADVELPLTVETSQLTYGELLESTRNSEYGISSVDWFNYITDSIKDEKERLLWYLDPIPENFTKWYIYEVCAAPGERVENRITSPLYPTINFTYEPYVYEYKYYLSPAANWASFGSLQVDINTPFKGVKLPKEFTETENGFTAQYSSLPQGELEFKLSTVQKPKVRNLSGKIILILFAVYVVSFPVGFVVCSLVLVIIAIVKHCKKKRKINI